MAVPFVDDPVDEGRPDVRMGVGDLRSGGVPGGCATGYTRIPFTVWTDLLP